MHELSIALSIVELAQDEAQNRGNPRVLAVHLRLGLLTGVARDALLSSYELACEDTSLAGSRLVIEEIPGSVFCPVCDAKRRVSSPEWFHCSVCGGVASDIVEGRELEVVALEVEP